VLALAQTTRESIGRVPSVPREGKPIVMEKLSLDSQGGKVDVYVARPSEEGVRPAVVVAHEWWGLNDQVKGVADRLAGLGYVALVPDLYRGFVTDDPEKAHEYLRGLPDERALADMTAAIAWARASKGVRKDGVGVLGFCMGGRIALLTNLSPAAPNACVVFYGTPVTDAAQLKKASGPVLGIFGADDRGIPKSAIQEMEKGLTAAGRSVETKIYEGAGHAFMNETRDSHRPAAAADAWKRVETFLGRTLAR
jgi:carboxymethylenebutenolidase